ncbi:MAG: glycosyltransferase family 2 protein [Muribaculaceae bacterium]
MANSKTPIITIATVTYNAEAVIQRTIDSIRCQNCTNYEWVVVDGASSDGTLRHIESSGIEPLRLLSERDRGLYDAMNKAIDMARGEYIVFLNAGDAFSGSDVVARIVKAAESGADVIYGQTLLVDADNTPLGKRHLVAPQQLTMKSFARGMVVCHQAFVPRMSIVEHYDLQYRLSADYEWCLRCLKVSRHNAYLGDEPMVNYLVDGLSAQHRANSLRERWQIMCRYFGFLPTLLRHISFVPRFVAHGVRMKMARKKADAKA